MTNSTWWQKQNGHFFPFSRLLEKCSRTAKKERLFHLKNGNSWSLFATFNYVLTILAVFLIAHKIDQRGAKS
jgi:hypothetical protein